MMIFQSFLLGNLVIKIINSVVVVGLYYGFLTTFSIGPSYLFLVQAQVEGANEKQVSATTGFMMGQLMMFISSYYAPLHLALARPHTITILLLVYLIGHLYRNIQTRASASGFFYYHAPSRSEMTTFSIQWLFLKNFIFQLFSPFFFPNSMLARLVNIYMFRCNNKMLFVTSSFVGWVIGQILFRKLLGLGVDWLRKKRRSNKYISTYWFLILEYGNHLMTILLFLTFFCYAGRTSSPLFGETLLGLDAKNEKKAALKTSMMKDETEEIQVNQKKDEFHTRVKETGYKRTRTKDWTSKKPKKKIDPYLPYLNLTKKLTRFYLKKKLARYLKKKITRYLRLDYSRHQKKKKLALDELTQRLAKEKARYEDNKTSLRLHRQTRDPRFRRIVEKLIRKCDIYQAARESHKLSMHEMKFKYKIDRDALNHYIRKIQKSYLSNMKRRMRKSYRRTLKRKSKRNIKKSYLSNIKKLRNILKSYLRNIESFYRRNIENIKRFYMVQRGRRSLKKLSPCLKILLMHIIIIDNLKKVRFSKPKAELKKLFTQNIYENNFMNHQRKMKEGKIPKNHEVVKFEITLPKKTKNKRPSSLQKKRALSLQKKRALSLKKKRALFLNKKIEKPSFRYFFDKHQWNRPFRYIENKNFEQAVRPELSQYFFDICKSDGKQRISFTHLPSLAIFLEMIKRRISALKKYPTTKLSNSWLYTNKQKDKNLNNEFLKRIETLDKNTKKFVDKPISFSNILETRTRLCNDNDKESKEYLSKKYDPLLNTSYRKTIYSSSILKRNITPINNFIETFWINRLHGVLFVKEFQQIIRRDINIKISQGKRHKLRKKEKQKKTKFINLINKVFTKKKLLTLSSDLFTLLAREGGAVGRNLDWYPRNRRLTADFDSRILIWVKSLLSKFLTNVNDQKIIKKSPSLKKISKKVRRWVYKLRSEIEVRQLVLENKNAAGIQIETRDVRSTLIFSVPKEMFDAAKDLFDEDPQTSSSDPQTSSSDPSVKQNLNLLSFDKRSDFLRDHIVHSLLPARRKVTCLKGYQPHPRGGLFVNAGHRRFIFEFLLNRNTAAFIKREFRKWMKKGKVKRFKILESTKSNIEKQKQEEAKRKRVIAKKTEEDEIQNEQINAIFLWDAVPYGMVIRTVALLAQSFFRKRVLLPSGIIAKNILLILQGQPLEWYEDFKKLKKEQHLICSYDGFPLNNPGLPEDWDLDHIQIKVIFPFYLHLSNKLESRSFKTTKKDVFFFNSLGSGNRNSVWYRRERNFRFSTHFKGIPKKT
uniref:Protein TIC 214 n=1 Tax=Schwalbea americana TaxID=86091 RepID=V6BQM9_9LAMI|nr:Ycf1/Tic214 [Schwalbea americana]CDJ38695.1 Ycf1/Tic214 [Schwalbea americana]